MANGCISVSSPLTVTNALIYCTFAHGVWQTRHNSLIWRYVRHSRLAYIPPQKCLFLWGSWTFI